MGAWTAEIRYNFEQMEEIYNGQVVQQETGKGREFSSRICIPEIHNIPSTVLLHSLTRSLSTPYVRIRHFCAFVEIKPFTPPVVNHHLNKR